MNQDTKFVIGIILACIVIFAGIIYSSGKAQEKANTPVSDEILIQEDSATIQGDGSVTLVEFIDLQCGACAAYHPLVKQILDEYEGKITFVLRYFPLHSKSVIAVQALEAAGEQNKYWEMLDIILASQAEWAAEDADVTELFQTYAQALELDVDMFTAVIESDAYRDKVARDRADGVKAGVEGTPTFFIDGIKLQNNPRSFADFKSQIDSALES